jgi:hypothetical protein
MAAMEGAGRRPPPAHPPRACARCSHTDGRRAPLGWLANGLARRRRAGGSGATRPGSLQTRESVQTRETRALAGSAPPPAPAGGPGPSESTAARAASATRDPRRARPGGPARADHCALRRADSDPWPRPMNHGLGSGRGPTSAKAFRVVKAAAGPNLGRCNAEGLGPVRPVASGSVRACPPSGVADPARARTIRRGAMDAVRAGARSMMLRPQPGGGTTKSQSRSPFHPPPRRCTTTQLRRSQSRSLARRPAVASRQPAAHAVRH